MSQYIVPEKYQNFIYSDIIKELDSALCAIEGKIEDEHSTNEIQNFFDHLQKIERNAEALCIYSEYLKNNNISEISGFTQDDFLVISARLYQKALEILSEASEKGIVVAPEQIFRYRLYSAINFYASRRHAISTAISQKLEVDVKNLKIDYKPVFWFYDIIIDLMRPKYYKQCTTKCDVALQRIKDTISTSCKSDNEQNIVLPFLGVSIKAVKNFVEAIQEGNLNNARKSVKKLNDQAKIFDKLGFTEISFVLFKLSFAINNLVDFSLWRLKEVLPYETDEQKSKVNQFIRQKTEIGQYFLFNSQYKAIFQDKILQKEHHQILSMPTGAGKTLLAHLLILKELLLRPSHRHKIIYLVPTRALAHEKLAEFEEFFSKEGLNYRICKITGEILIESEEVLEKNDILIMTQEKFDILLREENFFGFPIDSIISDEFHNVYLDYRGIRLQLCLERFKRSPQNKETKIFLISAILPKIDQKNISRWLYPEDDSLQVVFQTEWQPTFTRRGYFNFVDDSKKVQWNIEFNDGRTLKLNAPPGKIRADGINKAAAYIASQLSQEDQVYLYNSYRMGILERAEDVAHYLEKLDIAYVNQEIKQESIKKLKRIIGKNKFIDLFEKGVAVHHGHLPLAVRNIIENAISLKAVPIVCSTSTLAQGVNLPIKSIVIPKPQSRENLMELGFFLNLIGRAGRPGKTDEGQVILLTSKKRKAGYPDFPKEILDKFLNAKSDDIAENLSPVKFIKKFREKRNLTSEETAEYSVLLGVLEAMLLATIAEKGFDNFRDEVLVNAITIGSNDEEFRGFVRSLLIEIEERFVNEYKIVTKENKKLFVNPRGLVIYQSGFSPSTSINSANWLQSNIHLLNEMDRINYSLSSSDFYKIWIELLSVVMTSPEGQVIQGKFYLKTYKRSLWALELWARETRIEQIAQKCYDGDILEALSDVDGNLNGFVAWGLSAMSKWVHLIEIQDADEHEKKLFNLSKNVWFGANHNSPMNLMKLDDSKRLLREDVLTLSLEIQYRRIPDFIHKPEVLRDSTVRQKIKEIPQLKVDGNEVVENLLKIFEIYLK
jgi:hypothetical protein